MLRKLWNDETGAVLSTELVLICSILVIGAVTGLSTARDAIVTELADVGAAVANIDQSYSVAGIRSNTGFAAGFEFVDQRDPGDEAGAPAHPRGIIVCTTSFGSERRGGIGGGGVGPANPDLDSGGGNFIR